MTRNTWNRCTVGFEKLRDPPCGSIPRKGRPRSPGCRPRYHPPGGPRAGGQIKPAMLIYTLGITEHTCGVNNVLSCANLQMLLGNVGFECGGVNPLRGQNNVQGACDMGALPNVYHGVSKGDRSGD